MDPIVKMYLDRDEEGREKVRQHRKPAMRFRASGLMDCKRQEFYRQSGFVPTPRYGFNDDWGVDGDVHHDVVRQMLLAYGIKLSGITQAEDGSTDEFMFVTHDFDVDGRTITVSTRQDGWINHEDYGWMLMEIKSVGHWPMHYMQKAYEHGWTDELGVEHPPGEETALLYLIEKKPEWIAQILAGLAIARARGPESLPFDADEQYTLDHAYLVIKDRSNCHIGYHTDTMPLLGGIRVPFDQEKFDKILRRCYITKGKVLDGTPPLPEFPAGSKQCGYCPFKYLCHDADKRRKTGLEPAVVYPDDAIRIDFNDEPTDGQAVLDRVVRKDT
jgi:CRISPR/Cas system-associated exonuclease Cas4 (RecB family)